MQIFDNYRSRVLGIQFKIHMIPIMDTGKKWCGKLFVALLIRVSCVTFAIICDI